VTTYATGVTVTATMKLDAPNGVQFSVFKGAINYFIDNSIISLLTGQNRKNT